jgi:hypothetical protein
MSKMITAKRVGDMAQAVEYLSSKHKTLRNTSTTKRKKTKTVTKTT